MTRVGAIMEDLRKHINLVDDIENGTLYHLSKRDDIEKLTPMVPRKVASRNNAFEDDIIKRVSFAPSIEGCILGLQLSTDDFVNGEVMLNVYEPLNIHKKHLVSNETIVSKKLVFDADITKECWYLREVEVDNVGSITVYDKVDRIIEYTPIRVGDPKFIKPNGKLDTYLYEWEWNG